jgi:hypothetical protein
MGACFYRSNRSNASIPAFSAMMAISAISAVIIPDYNSINRSPLMGECWGQP